MISLSFNDKFFFSSCDFTVIELTFDEVCRKKNSV